MALVFKIKLEDTLRRLVVSKCFDETSPVLTFQELDAKIRELFNILSIAPLVITYVDKDNDVVTMVDDQDLVDACVVQRLNPLRLDVKVVKGTQSVGVDDEKTPKAFAGPSAEPREYTGERSAQRVFPEAAVDAVKQFLTRYPQLLLRDALQALDEILKTLTGQGESTTHGGRPRAAPGSSKNASFDPSKESFGCQPRPQGTFVGSNKGRKGEASTRIFHTGVQCDGCRMCPIEGPRFKSMRKFNYDLCSSCFNEIGNETDYQRIDHPMHSHRNNHYQLPCATRMMQQPVGPPPFRTSFSQCPYSWKPVCPFRGYSENANAAGKHAGRKLDARFVQDVTIFDGTELTPGTKFTKIWRLSNIGTLPWPQHTRLVRAGGDVLGSDKAVNLKLPEEGVPCSKDIEVAVDLVAPERAGHYASHWCLMTPSGQRFGQRGWVSIQVVPKGEESPQMQESLSGEEELKAEEDSIPATSAICSVAVEDSVLKAASTDETVEAFEAPNFGAADEHQAEYNISGVVSSELGGFSMLDKAAENDSGKLNVDWVDLSRQSFPE